VSDQSLNKDKFIENFFQKKLFEPLEKLEKDMKKMTISEVDEALAKFESFFQNILEHMDRQDISLLDYEKESTKYFLILNRIKHLNHRFIRRLGIFR
jgi:TusA-related sulfurtransferase